MKITILTLFPDFFTPMLSESIIKRAILNEVVTVKVVDIRDYSLDKHHHVDDTPYGGGQGMVLKIDVLHRAILANSTDQTFKILLTPQGKTYKQNIALDLSKKEDILLICGHYEGFDERILNYIDLEISIGDYVLTGGELAAMVLADSIIRLLDGATRKESHEDDSFSTGLLEYPQFTRPKTYDGYDVPEVLIDGHHEKIRLYRLEESLKKTYLRRPDLLENYELSLEEKKILDKIIKDEENGK